MGNLRVTTCILQGIHAKVTFLWDHLEDQRLKVDTFGEYLWYGLNNHLEDHPSGCKWLITIVIVSPLNGVIPLINGLNGL